MHRQMVAIVLVTSALAVCSCGSRQPEPATRILGSWVSDDGRVSTFSANGEFAQLYQENTYYSHWETISSDTLKFTGRSSTNQYAQQDPDYVGYCAFSFDSDGNLILDGKLYARQE
jgi:hypothetical protein